jgi:YVTN family beta-propeller protein
VEFGVLGPIEVRESGRELPLGGPKQRALLAFLLLRANEAVSRDRLIEALWGERPPATAAHTLDTYVSRLRKLLGDDRLTRRPPGYLLRVQPGELDLDRFDELVARGREQLAAGQAHEAAESLVSALGIWRGPALADVLYEPFASFDAEPLEDRRLSALEDRVESELASGRSSELIPELEQLVRDHPFRERLLGQLMLALYRSGQQARALEAYRAGRRRLAEELGLEPGASLRELEQRILAQDPALTAPARAATRPPQNRRRVVVAALVVAVAAGAASGFVIATNHTSGSSLRSDVNQIVGLDLRTGRADQTIELGGAPAAVAAGPDSLWLADPGNGTVAHADPREGAIVDRVPIRGAPGLLAVGGGSVWAANVPGDRVLRIDPETGTITQTISLAGARLSALAFGSGGLWIGDLTDQTLLEVDPSSGTVRRTLRLSVTPSAVAVGRDAIWVADYGQGTVTEVDPARGNVLATVHVGTGPSALAADHGAVWVANTLDSTVSRIDPATGSVTATIPVGSTPAAVAVSGGSVWVANRYSASVSLIDPRRNQVVKTRPVGGSPTSLAAVDGRMWVGIRSLAQRRGGTLTLLHTRPITIDPAVQADLLPLVSDGLTRDGLVSYNHVPGPAGTQLVPDLAISLPVAGNGGTTYTFRLRPGVRYSDGRPLRASDFRRAIERVLRLRSSWAASFTGILGAAECRPSSCDLSRGVVADDAARTVTFRLRAPDAGLIANLTSAAASPVPPGTPWRHAGTTPILGTGPYRIVSADRREIRWTRNPYFREWSHAAQPDGNPDEIVMRFGRSPAQAVHEIEAGRADWSAENLPPELLPSLRARFAARLHNLEIPTTDFLQLNTKLPPFDDVRVRRALNFVIDRREIVRMYGGPDVATPTCQILPPGIPGYRAYCPYTLQPARARRLVAASGTQGEQVTIWGWTDDPTISPRIIHYMAKVLRTLGYRTRVRLVPHAFLDNPQPGVFERIQLIATAWGDTPYGYFANFFTCNGPLEHGWSCYGDIERDNRRARLLSATDPRAAAAIWARLDRELVDRAVWVPMINEHGVDFVSARVRNYQSHPYWGLIADQLWVR